MKKIVQLFSFVVIVCILMFSYENVFAGYSIATPVDCYDTNNDNERVCTVKFTISSDSATSYNWNVIPIIYSVSNYKVTSFTPTESWFVESKGVQNNQYTYQLKTTLSQLEVGKEYVVATVHFSKIDVLAPAAGCYTNLHAIIPKYEERKCTSYQGIYYDKNGKIVTYQEYDKQCNEHICEKLSDGTMFGKNGTEVDATTYLNECGHVCELFEGKYYGIDGTEVDQNTYNAQCNPKCKIQDGIYYGKDGSVVSELNYQKQCGKNICVILSDGTMYDKDGKEINNKLQYQKECEENYCTILSDGTMYGINGNVVDQETFDKECKDPNYCKVIDGKYYDIAGEETTEMNYKIQCERHTCEIIDGNYFDANGNLVSEGTYKESCEKKPSCEVINGIYYDKEGKEVSKESYEAACTEVKENPKTGAIVSIVTLVGLGICGFGFIYFAKKHNRLV